MEKELNFNLKLPVSPPSTLDPSLFKEFTVIYNSLRLVADEIGGGNMLQWNDFFTSGLVTGWSSLSINLLQYRYLNLDTILIDYYLSGVSNSTSVGFLLPVVPSSSNYYSTGLSVDNGVSVVNPARVFLSAGNKSVIITKDLSGANWTNSGTKSIAGQFIYRIT